MPPKTLIYTVTVTFVHSEQILNTHYVLKLTVLDVHNNLPSKAPDEEDISSSCISLICKPRNIVTLRVTQPLKAAVTNPV